MWLVLLLVLCSPVIIFAETIVLKSGKTVEGKIIEKTDNYIKVDFQGVPLTYYADEIESVDGAKQNSFSMVEQKSSQENNLTSVNVEAADEYLRSGIVYLKQGNLSQAISDFTKAMETDHNCAEAYNNRGNIYRDQGNLSQAFFDFAKAIEINPKYAEAYSNRGLAYLNQINLIQAISDCTRAIEIDPNFAEAYYNRGLTYVSQGSFTQAISDYTKAIEINPNFADAYYGRGLFYTYVKEYDKAWADVHKAEGLGLSVDPDFIKDLKKLSGRDK